MNRTGEPIGAQQMTESPDVEQAAWLELGRRALEGETQNLRCPRDGGDLALELGPDNPVAPGSRRLAAVGGHLRCSTCGADLKITLAA